MPPSIYLWLVMVVAGLGAVRPRRVDPGRAEEPLRRVGSTLPLKSFLSLPFAKSVHGAGESVVVTFVSSLVPPASHPPIIAVGSNLVSVGVAPSTGCARDVANDFSTGRSSDCIWLFSGWWPFRTSGGTALTVTRVSSSRAALLPMI